MFQKGKYKAILLTSLLLVGSLLTWAVQHRYFKGNTVVAFKVKETLARKFVYDKKLLATYERVTKYYDSLSKKNYTMSGTLNLTDGADTSDNLKGINFLMCKVGEEFYYRLGKVETINEDGVYLMVDNTAKKIVVTEQKKLGTESYNPNLFTHLGDNLQSEQYNLTGKVNGSVQTISFINETHITCKQYSMSFDTLNIGLKHLYLRLTNFQEPEKRDKEKVISVQVNEFDSRADLKKYLSKQEVLRKAGSGWKTVGAFEEYELITR